ncbi:hypothetical protein [Kineosporia sp. R_H_3]|uniref:hypothetical protein n=1 Tax=Kineosporia sp. R_H_3 TaxID=1961848 RepID=UPI00130454B0|nr:hypothetical protein [Kineosporia sp. R_H_3]
MIPTPANGVARVVGALVRRADATLAVGAARNAAVGMAAGRARHLDELRTLRDLRSIEESFTSAERRPAPRRSARA